MLYKAARAPIVATSPEGMNLFAFFALNVRKMCHLANDLHIAYRCAIVMLSKMDSSEAISYPS